MPLDRDDYSSDLRSLASKDDFDNLLVKATVDVVGPTKSRKHAYESAGQAVVDRSDVLVAVWDGKRARGRGGTAEIHAYAVQRKKPIFWIRVDGDSAELADWPSDLGASQPVLLRESLKRLDSYNGESLPALLFTDPPPLMTDLSSLGGSVAASTVAPLVQHIGRYLVQGSGVFREYPFCPDRGRGGGGLRRGMVWAVRRVGLAAR